MEWISVKEKLPEDGCGVMAIRKRGRKFYEPFVGRYVDGIFFTSGEIPDPDADLESSEFVTHWMPLPEPPKESN